jgi:hypothetical protein
MLEIEGWRYDAEREEWIPGKDAWRVERRIMDPRFGGSPVPSDEQGTTIISQLGDDLNANTGEPNRDWLRRAVPGMDWEQAPGGSIDAGIEQLVGLMDYDESRPVGPDNAPRLFINEACTQSKIAYEEFTLQSTKDNCLKDPVDCGRYFAVSDCVYVEPGRRAVRRQGRHY